MSAIQSTYLAISHPHPRDQTITFEDSTHTYTIYDSSTNTYDSSFTSVTTWNHKHFEPFDEDKIISRMMNGKRWNQSKYYGMTPDEIKAQWEETRQEASSAGTKLHKDIELYYNQNSIDNSSVEFQYFLNFESMRKRRFPTLEPYRTEWMIYHEDWRLAGSVDMVFRDICTDELWIYDWKRSKKITKTNPWQNAINPEINHIPDCNFWHYALQLNTYKAILENKYDCKIAGMCLVCLHPNQSNYERIPLPDLKNEIHNLIQRPKVL